MKGKIVIERNMFYGAGKSIFLKAIELRNNPTQAEMILWEQLKDKDLFACRFKRQHPIDIFIADFYCHKYKLVIEVDGEIHSNPDNNEYDKGREFEMEKYGIRILRFTNREVIENINNVIAKIKQEIHSLSPL
jgi:very-short-patch-repair endonuclease